MSKKIFMVCTIFFVSNLYSATFSDVNGLVRKHLPKQLENNLSNEYFINLGNFVSENISICESYKNLYHKLLNTQSSLESDIISFSYGVMEGLILKDFISKAKLDIKNISGDALYDIFAKCADNGVRVFDSFEEFENAKQQTESFSNSLMISYSADYDYTPVNTKTFCNYIQMMKNLHLTFQMNKNIIKDEMFIYTNASSYFPGDRIVLQISSKNITGAEEVSLENQQQIFDISDKNISETITDLVYEDYKIFEGVVSSLPVFGEFGLYADGKHFLNNVKIEFANPLDFDMRQIAFSPFVIHVKDDYQYSGQKVIHPFDLIFVGGFPDDMDTPDIDESETNLAIPGKYTHLIVYLGRTPDGTPYAMEMTTSLEDKNFNFRLVRISDFMESYDSGRFDSPIVSVDLYKYKNLDAKRLKAEDFNKIMSNKDLILSRIHEDIKNMLPYEFQFFWSQDMSDKNIYLIDDGFSGGIACTDYWLYLFEELAGVCIKGSRADKSELISYFTTDSVGKTVKIPSTLNPFPFDVFIRDIVGFLGFEIHNPPPHYFSCDGTEETGISIPTKLYFSEGLEQIGYNYGY